MYKAVLILILLPLVRNTQLDSVDLIEKNTYYDENGRKVFTQWIAWTWTGSRHEVAGWRLDKEYFHFQEQPPRLTWYEDSKHYELRAAYWRETHYQWDEEITERERLPVCKRRGLFGSK